MLCSLLHYILLCRQERANGCLALVATTHDQDVFSFLPDDTFCNGFEEVLARYREIVPQLRLAG